MDVAHPVHHRVSSVEFSFQQPENIKSLSVKRITNPLIFDNLDHPAPNGLYDPALGPIAFDAKCTTCSLNYHHCPGHFGHIELIAPVYNTITFKLMYKLLQSTCFCCHHFRIPETVVALYIGKLELVHRGLIVEASDLDRLLSIPPKSNSSSKSESNTSKSKKSTKGKKQEKASLTDTEAMEVDGEEEEEEEVEDVVQSEINTKNGNPLSFAEAYIQRIQDYVQDCLKKNPRSATRSKSSLVTDTLRRLERDFLRSLSTSNSCHRCGGYSPKLRKEEDVKIFQQPLSQNYKVMMAARGLTFESLFGESTVAASHPVGKAEERDRFLTPIQVQQHIQLLWKKELRVLDLLFGTAKSSGTAIGERKSDPSMFFFSVIAVTPNRFRPVSKMGDMLFEHPQNIQLVEILKSNLELFEIRRQTEEIEARAKKENSIEAELAAESQTADHFKRMIDAWIKLQKAVNYLIDSSKAPAAGGKLPPPGIRQVLEKKEGLFRKHMMGKRVNYAARSVISPDPYIETNEIGIPPVFATKLTYPEPVTSHNVKMLRQYVINGPEKWPGATHVQNEDGTLVSLAAFDEAGRRSIANQLMTPPLPKDHNSTFRIKSTNKKVYRHLRNGDFLLLNRQPTLHKPSIMAHTARVLPGEKTIRMHYANCNTYNADFDGDEMNAHFPQNEIARAEAMLIARTDQQYLVPTDGGVLRGLIQDHVDAGVDMCSRDTFLTRSEYMQLVYIGLLPEGSLAAGIGNGNIEQALKIGRKGRIVTIPPAIFKPEPRWTGKQVLSTILMNLLPEDRALLNLKSKSRIPAKQWGPTAPEEQQVWIMDGYLLTGILDKSQFGASAKGLVHGIYEVYGPPFAGKLLSILGRLFTGYLQMIGFSCRMDDLRLTDAGDSIRRGLIDGAQKIGLEATSEYVGLTPVEATNNKRKLELKVEEVIRDSEKMAGLDSAMKSRTNKVTSKIISSCIPDHLLKPFPANNMQVMTVSGAKGSAVNVSQISCLLGQQELEGKRVPMMISGKTLPSFLAFDTSARAGGFITGRFLTGIKPQEYYFHCMAGREGLIDTAVKTSRSGYLQRCLIKHLEGLKVHYDHTVRDVDGSILQFRYGEDALDTVKQTTLTNFDFCALNYRALLKRYDPSALAENVDEEAAKKYLKRQKKRHGLDTKNGGEYSDPVLSAFSPSRHLGAVSDKFREILAEYVEKNPLNLLKPKSNDSSEKSVSRPSWSAPFISGSKFSGLMNVKYMHSLVEPGEAVGLLAAQSIGEPSTQMTLNTFHFAGFGAKNVTLGIPRLREIIMTASDHIKTPLMRLPMAKGVSEKKAERICETISKLVLSQIMENVTVTEELRSKNADGHPDRKKWITIRLHFWPKKAYGTQYDITPEDIGHVIEKKFVPSLERAIVKTLKAGSRKLKEVEEIGVGVKEKTSGTSSNEEANAEESIPASREKRSRKKTEEMDSDDEENAAGEDSDLEGVDGDATDTRIQARRAQKATYDGPDEDDAEVLRDAGNLSDEDDNESSAGPNDVEDEDEVMESTAALRSKNDSDRNREQRISVRSRYAKKYAFDSKEGRWCDIVLCFPADTKKMLMVAMVESVCKNVVIREVPGIQRCYPLPNESENDTSINIGTDGVNLTGLWEYDNVINMNEIYTNDISAILKTFGVEAARAAIMKEIAGVFGVYGISVDSRHLSIIADYMTFEGGYKPFNRIGINSNPSPFAQMSFETTTNFLTTATLSGDFDPLDSPSARLVLGQPVKGGTGSFDILQPLTGF